MAKHPGKNVWPTYVAVFHRVTYQKNNKKKMKTVSADETEIASAHQNVSALLPQTG